MLTKDDLSAIQSMFDSSKKETNKRFISMDERFESIDKRFDIMDERFDSMDKRIDSLSNSMQKNTEELIELITAGFNLNEERLVRIESEVFKSKENSNEAMQ